METSATSESGLPWESERNSEEQEAEMDALADFAQWRVTTEQYSIDLDTFAKIAYGYQISCFRVGVVVPGSSSGSDIRGDFRSFGKLKLEFEGLNGEAWYNQPRGGPSGVIESKSSTKNLFSNQLIVDLDDCPIQDRPEGADLVQYRVVLALDIIVRRLDRRTKTGASLGTLKMSYDVTTVPSSNMQDITPVFEITELPVKHFQLNDCTKKYKAAGVIQKFAAVPSWISIANEGTHNFLHFHFVKVNGRDAVGLQICDSNGQNGMPVSLHALQDEDIRLIGPGLFRKRWTEKGTMGKLFNEYRFHRGSGQWLLTSADEIWFAGSQEDIPTTPQFDKTIPLMYYSIKPNYQAGSEGNRICFYDEKYKE